MNQSILEQKKELVDLIANKMNEAASTVVVEYRGLTVAELTELRRKLREEDVEMVVYKNSMVQRATEKLGYSDLMAALKGPNAVAFSKDEIAASRVLCDFAKKHDKLIVKSGIVEKKVVDGEGLKALAKLPNHDGMISMFLGCLQSPVRSFACAVKAIADKASETEAN